MKAIRLALAVIAAIAVAFAINLRTERAAANRLPPMPALIARPQLLVTQLQSANALARRSPTSASAVGSLGMAYHSDLFYVEALTAYRLASVPTNRW